MQLARQLGADDTVLVEPTNNARAIETIRAITASGAHVSLDAFGSAATCQQSIACLRKRGRHVQVGLLTEDDRSLAIPMARVVAEELRIFGSHGIAAPEYTAMFRLMETAGLQPVQLVTRRGKLSDLATWLPRMNDGTNHGISVAELK